MFDQEALGFLGLYFYIMIDYFLFYLEREYYYVQKIYQCVRKRDEPILARSFFICNYFDFYCIFAGIGMTGQGPLDMMIHWTDGFWGASCQGDCKAG